MTDPFAQYKLPVGLTEGVKIPLTGTPAVFTVRLPGAMNEDFNLQLMSEVNIEREDDGSVKFDAKVFQITRRRIFFEQCILKAEGLPDGMGHAEFFKIYGLAAKTVFDRANELAAQADEEANAALGKLESTPNGKFSGAGGTNSTTKSSKRASKSAQPAPN